MIFQALYDLCQIPTRKGLPGRLRRLARSLRKRLLRHWDPLVRVNIGQTSLSIPFSHALPLYQAERPQYSQNLGRITRALAAKYPGLKVIDVGANVGDSAALIKTGSDCPILCLEGSPAYFTVLQKNAAAMSQVIPLLTLLGERNEVREVSYQLDSGTAVISALDAKTDQKVTLQTLDSILEKQPDFKTAKLLKTDVDGADPSIIRGSIGLLQNSAPAIFFEHDPVSLKLHREEPAAIFRFLAESGYPLLLIWDNFGEYLCCAETANEKLLDDLFQFSARGNLISYLDILALSRADEDLFDSIRRQELALFQKTA